MARMRDCSVGWETVGLVYCVCALKENERDYIDQSGEQCGRADRPRR